MDDEKDRFGEKMRLVERAKEDIYFAQKDRELIEKLKARLKRVEKGEQPPACPKCDGKLESYSLHGIVLDRCPKCGGIWLDRGELEEIVRTVAQSPLASAIDRWIGEGGAPKQADQK